MVFEKLLQEMVGTENDLNRREPTSSANFSLNDADIATSFTTPVN